jgi:uncharacterized protein DUF4272
MDLLKVRKNSLKTAQKLGYPINEKLPLIDLPLNLRQVEEIGRRMMALKAVLACAFSPDSKAMVQKWINQENLSESLTKTECKLIFEGKGNSEGIELEIESLWMLAWSVNLIQKMDYGEYCSDFLSDLLPSLENMDSSIPFMRNLNLRPLEEITEALDLAYCLNGGAIQARIDNITIPNKVREYVIEYRRKALEWLVSEEDWDKVITN